MSDKVEERKDKMKPTKMFTISAVVFDDGIVTGQCIEYRDLGRLKNQKLIVPDGADFISLVRSSMPSAREAVQPLVDCIFRDMSEDSAEGSVKIAKAVVDVYSDGYIDCDFSEIVQGDRGAPKAWRLSPYDFFNHVENQVGQASPPFKALTSEGGKVSGEITVDAKITSSEETVGQIEN